jgi:4-hydroxy-tetrahydrodipicolinate reductase
MPSSERPRSHSSRAEGPRLLVAGGSGRVGQAVVVEAAAQGLAVVRLPGRAHGRTPRPSARDADSLRRALRSGLAGADVFVTATGPETEAVQLPVVAEAGIPAVVATTGLEPPPAWLRRAADRVPIVLDANFSQGIQLLRRAIRAIGPLPDGFDASIVEAHRRKKPDHPSGTARTLAGELRASGYARWTEATGARQPRTVEIASLRGGETPGVHELWLAGPGELLRFEHVVLDRAAFATGMLRAARWLHARRREVRPGLYSLRDVLDGGVP